MIVGNCRHARDENCSPLLRVAFFAPLCKVRVVWPVIYRRLTGTNPHFRQISLCSGCTLSTPANVGETFKNANLWSDGHPTLSRGRCGSLSCISGLVYLVAKKVGSRASDLSRASERGVHAGSKEAERMCRFGDSQLSQLSSSSKYASPAERQILRNRIISGAAYELSHAPQAARSCCAF